MSTNFYANTLSTKPHRVVTPQTQAIPGREAEMVTNSTGAMTFTLDMWGYLDRFLILGSDRPSYYASSTKLTLDAAANVLVCIAADGAKTVNRIIEISTGGRAPKNDPAIFALALCAVNGASETVDAAYAALPKVCRIGTHLFQFVSALDTMGKWNAAAKRGVAAWYTNRNVDKLALQLLKYQQRGGWAHRDVLRLAHVKPQSEIQSNLFRYAVKGADGMEFGQSIPALVVAVETLKREPTKRNALSLIEANPDMTWEMIPTELHRDRDVMLQLIPNMGMTAVIRKLGQLTNIGVIAPLSTGSNMVISKLTDTNAIKQGRVHPLTILSALRQYQVGQGSKGSLSWKPDQRVVDALNAAFYDSFQYIESTGQRYMIGVDCSGSMFSAAVSGAPGLNAADVAGVMAMAIVKREPNSWVGGFNRVMSELKITPSMRLDNVLKVIANFHWGATDVSLVPLTALKMRMKVDCMITITDNETNCGSMHPTQALNKYRTEMRTPHTKQVVCGTSVTGFTVADPTDPFQLDVVGFDSAVPQLIQDFAKIR